MTRQEHLAWCKERALGYLDANSKYFSVQDAYTSMVSDLRKHPETENHVAIELGMMQLIGGHLNSPEKMRHFIEGFN